VKYQWRVKIRYHNQLQCKLVKHQTRWELAHAFRSVGYQLQFFDWRYGRYNRL